MTVGYSKKGAGRSRWERAGHSGVEPKRDGLLFGVLPLLCKGFVVEVQDDLIIVRVSGTSYSASYYWTSSSTDLLALRLPMRDDHRAPMSRLEFIKSAWQLANDKVQKLKWIR